MKAIVCEEFAPVQQLRLREVPDPVAGPGEILIDIRAAGVNYPDALLVQGLYQSRPPRPFIPGSEIAGVVSGLGPGVTQFRPGERVMGCSVLGGFAEKIVLPAASVMRIPECVPDDEAAGLVVAHSTAHHALKQRAQLRPGESLVVTGAAGGTGLAAVQIGKALGARVIAVCSTAQKLAVARAHGADVLIDYRQKDLKSELKELLGAPGADVAYDTVGGEAFDALTRCMGWRGRLLVVGFASGRIPQFPVNLALVKGYSVVGVYWGSFAQQQPQDAAENLQELLGWYGEGKVRVVIDATFPLAETALAIGRVMNREAIGKVIVKP